MKLCTDSWCIYKTIQCKAGEIEAFNLLTNIRVTKQQHSVQHGMELLDAVSQVEKVCALLRKRTAAFTADLSNIEDFYGLEKHGSTVYCVPRKYGYFLQPIFSKKYSCDTDGMLQADQASILKQIQDHYQKYIKHWKEYVKNLKEPWETKVKLLFPFHSELLMKPFYLQKQHQMFPTELICEYLRLFEVALQLSRLSYSAFNRSDIITLFLRLLSPFSQISLPFQQESFAFIGKSKILQDLLTKKISQVLKKTFCNTQDTPNIDEWLQAWNVMCIIKKNNIVSYEISMQRNRINNLVKVQAGYDPSRHPPYSYLRRENSYQSIFGMWELTCKLYREDNKSLVATRISVVYFIQTIARRRSLNVTFSIENLICILTIQSTALFAMISASRFKEQLQNIFFVPESFEQIIKMFDLINCDCLEGKKSQMLSACFSTSEDVSSHKILKDSVKLLKYILDVLLGIYKPGYQPLERAMNYGTDTEAVHSLVLTLTVFGNLVLYEFLSPKDCQHIHTKIVSLLQGTVTSKLSVREKFIKVVQSTNTKDLFESAISTLLMSVGLRLMSLQTELSQGKAQIVIKPCESQQIAKVDYKWEPYLVTPQLLSKKEEIE